MSTIRNRLNIDVQISTHIAMGKDEKSLIFIDNLIDYKINNKEIGAIIEGSDSRLGCKSSISIDDETPENIYQMKQKFYDKFRDTKKQYLKEVVDECNQRLGVRYDWDKLVKSCQSAKCKVSNFTLKVKLTMQHIVPKQESYQGYIMSRYNERPGYYSSNQQVAEFNVPLKDKKDIDTMVQFIYELITSITGTHIDKSSKRQSVADYTDSLNVKQAKEYLRNVKQSPLKEYIKTIDDNSNDDDDIISYSDLDIDEEESSHDGSDSLSTVGFE